MMERQRVTTIATVSEIDSSGPVTITFAKRLRRGGAEKLHVQQVIVSDAILAARLPCEVNPGDAAEITLETLWHEATYETVLVGFHVLSHGSEQRLPH